jgi:hypothetical protein
MYFISGKSKTKISRNTVVSGNPETRERAQTKVFEPNYLKLMPQRKSK